MYICAILSPHVPTPLALPFNKTCMDHVLLDHLYLIAERFRIPRLLPKQSFQFIDGLGIQITTDAVQNSTFHLMWPYVFAILFHICMYIYIYIFNLSKMLMWKFPPFEDPPRFFRRGKGRCHQSCHGALVCILHPLRPCSLQEEWESKALREHLGNIYIYLEPVCPLFWGLNPPKQGLFKQNKGHLGSRYIYIWEYMVFTRVSWEYMVSNPPMPTWQTPRDSRAVLKGYWSPSLSLYIPETNRPGPPR